MKNKKTKFKKKMIVFLVIIFLVIVIEIINPIKLYNTYQLKNLNYSDISVESIKNISEGDSYSYELTISVENIDKLNKYINDLRMLNKIISIERVIK